MAATVKVLKKPKRTLMKQVYVPAVASGVAMTLERFIKNTLGPEDGRETATIMYPEEQREYPARFRGVHRLMHRTDGSPRCVIETAGLEAVAGLNWSSPGFAEIYVHVDGQQG